MAAKKGVIDLESQKNDRIHWKPRCIDYWSKWRSCVASSNQFHKYYQYGEFDDCEIHQKDLKNCFLWKTRKSIDALETGIPEENLVEPLFSHDSLISRKHEEEIKKSSEFAHSVWEKRENPGKDWERD